MTTFNPNTDLTVEQMLQTCYWAGRRLGRLAVQQALDGWCPERPRVDARVAAFESLPAKRQESLLRINATIDDVRDHLKGEPPAVARSREDAEDDGRGDTP
ncbi:MAG TPA: hypothetical protein VM238_01640 [Phycisphaerae bacterium]|nr:hypothetical protein [Phycisphaerae bacterium]HUW99425.1 hypothetical protein [Phycisphaerae bacterium]